MEGTKKIFVQRGHGSNQFGADIDIAEISDVHWDNCSGGVHRYQRGYSLYGYIDYHKYKDQVKCSGRHDYGDNDMKVLIPRVPRDDPSYSLYKILCDEAGEKPKAFPTCSRKLPPCTKQILHYLESGEMTRGELRQSLYDDEYERERVCNAIRTLIIQNKIFCIGSPYSKYQIIKKT